ncbi:TPA: hypothetical protein OCD43_005143, partial [Escherichia coli]|nr:hypothetical protein [Escherichia coli]HCO9576964.1 hypothetical protein [Escherichia coli]
PAYIPQPAGYFPRHFKSPLFKTLFKTFFKTLVETFLYKTFCNSHTALPLLAKKPGILPGFAVLINE